VLTTISRNRNFDDPLACNQQLDDDFCIEVKVVGIALQWTPFERLYGISTVTAVEFAQVGMGQLVLDTAPEILFPRHF